MKTKLFLFTLASIIFGSSFFMANATETVPCGNALIDYKKQWLSTNCKQKIGYTCLLRCDQPEFPDPPTIGG